MFDIGFPELILVSIVALVVIGPERLPETVRTIMLWLGRIRQTFTNIKTELEQEIGADEIRRQLHNETVLKEIKDSKESITNTIKDTMSEIDESVDEFKQGIADLDPTKPLDVTSEHKTDGTTEDRSKDALKDASINTSTEASLNTGEQTQNALPGESPHDPAEQVEQKTLSNELERRTN